MTRRGHLRTALAQPGFRRLFDVRIAGQFGDGVFQASLAGAVLFDPQRQSDAADIAAAFTVLLVPYSLIGPFAGVLLDRWWRQRVLVRTNLLRAACVVLVAVQIGTGVTGVALYAGALVVISMGRFVLSALSAALPHVVDAQELVTANSLSTTCGAIATTAGGGAAIAVRAVLGDTNLAYAAIAVAAAVPYLLAAAPAHGFGRNTLGPDAAERARRESVLVVARGLVAGARHVYEREPVRYALAAIGVHRICYGVWTVCALLLYRNYFSDDGPWRAGLTGLGQLVVVVAIGGGLASLVTPAAARRLGYGAWPALLLALAAVVQILCGLPYTLPLMLASGLLLGFAAQGIKISVDTLVQYRVDDEYRGRVFALYDTLFNIALVVAAVLTALVLPADGHAPIAVVVLGCVYAVAALGYLLCARSTGDALVGFSPADSRTSA